MPGHVVGQVVPPALHVCEQPPYQAPFVDMWSEVSGSALDPSHQGSSFMLFSATGYALIRPVVVATNTHADPPFSFSARFWTAPTIERALSAAGFHEVAWSPPRCSPQGLAEHGEGHWATMLEHPVMRFFTCRA